MDSQDKEFSEELKLRQDIMAAIKDIDEGGAIPDLPLIGLELVDESYQELFKEAVIKNFDSLIIRALQSIDQSASAPLSPFRRVSELFDYLDSEQRHTCLAHFVRNIGVQHQDKNKLLGQLAFAASTERLLDNPKSPMALGLCGELVGLCGDKKQQQMFHGLLNEASEKGLIPESSRMEYSSKLLPSSKVTVDLIKAQVDERVDKTKGKIRDLSLCEFQQTYRDEIIERMNCIEHFVEAALSKEFGDKAIPIFKNIQKKFIEKPILTEGDLEPFLVPHSSLFTPEEKNLFFRKKTLLSQNDGQDGLRTKVKTALFIYGELQKCLEDKSKCDCIKSIQDSFTEIKSLITEKMEFQDRGFKAEVDVENHFRLPIQEEGGGDDDELSGRLEA